VLAVQAAEHLRAQVGRHEQGPARQQALGGKTGAGTQLEKPPAGQRREGVVQGVRVGRAPGVVVVVVDQHLEPGRVARPRHV
jgi:hypothetical protein